MANNVVRTITIRGTSEGLDKLQADLAKVAAGHKNVTVATEETERSSLSFEQALKRQSLRLDEVARAQNNIERETKLANRGLKEGLIDQQRHAELLTLANQRYGTTSKATQEFGKQTGLARHELINLGRQAQDVGVSLVSGQSPLMVLAQQGSQIADVFISSGKSVGSFFSQAIGWAGRFFTSTAGIVTAIGAIGAAAVYAASQFVKGSTTVEEALAEQKRLMDENKTAVGGLIDAQIKLNTTSLTRFQSLENERDLWGKLRTAMEEVAKVAERRVTKPGEVPGEMGLAPTGLTPLKDPGFAQINDAISTLRNNMEAGRPGVAAFMDELGRVGEVTPEARKLVNRLLETAQASLVLEAAALKASAALKSVAQTTLSVREIKESAEAAERQAKATLEMAAAYPGMSIEGAKMLNSLSGQLQMAQAIGPMAQIEVQYRLRLVELTNQLGAAEATRIAGMERAVSLAQIETQHKQTMLQLQGQLSVAQQVTGLGQINAQHAATVALLTQQIGLTRAIEQADMQRAIALAQVNTAAQVRLRDLQNEMQLIKAVDDIARDRIRSEQTLNKLLAEGVDWYTAQQVAAQELANATEQRAQQEYDANRAAMEAAQNAQLMADATAQTTNNVAQTASFVAQTAADVDRIIAANREIARTHAFLPSWIPTDQLVRRPDGTYSQFGGSGGGGAGGGGYVSSVGLEFNTIMDDYNKLIDATEKLTDATKQNTSATSAMTDVLSPFYSSDPRRTHLGFRSFAGGGIMTEYGALPLRQYQGGGMATSPQVAVFGEGSTPEAYVPVPSGRIPVEIKAPANSNQRPINVTINVMGNAGSETVAALRQTGFQKAQQLRRMTG